MTLQGKLTVGSILLKITFILDQWWHKFLNDLCFSSVHYSQLLRLSPHSHNYNYENPISYISFERDLFLSPSPLLSPGYLSFLTQTIMGQILNWSPRIHSPTSTLSTVQPSPLLKNTNMFKSIAGLKYFRVLKSIEIHLLMPSLHAYLSSFPPHSSVLHTPLCHQNKVQTQGLSNLTIAYFFHFISSHSLCHLSPDT